MATVGLFIPCYVDQLYPRVAMATLELLERSGFEVVFPAAQTCCGQPMANTGCTEDARPLAERFFKIFKPYDYVVAPWGSCVAMVRHHYDEFWPMPAGFAQFKAKTFELCEFLCDVARVTTLPVRFPYRVGLHQSCHGLRELRLGSASELVGPVVQQGAAIAGGDRWRGTGHLAAGRRMLRFRRHVCRGRGSGVMPDGRRSDCRSPAGRRPGADGQRHVVLDALGWVDSPAEKAAARDARGRNPGRLSVMNHASWPRNSCATRIAYALARQHAVVRADQTRQGGPVAPGVGDAAQTAGGIKAHTMSRLADYLEEFERQATAVGRPGPLGRRRRGAQPDRARNSPAAQRASAW